MIRVRAFELIALPLRETEDGPEIQELRILLLHVVVHVPASSYVYPCHWVEYVKSSFTKHLQPQ